MPVRHSLHFAAASATVTVATVASWRGLTAHQRTKSAVFHLAASLVERLDGRLFSVDVVDSYSVRIECVRDFASADREALIDAVQAVCK